MPLEHFAEAHPIKRSWAVSPHSLIGQQKESDTGYDPCGNGEAIDSFHLVDGPGSSVRTSQE